MDGPDDPPHEGKLRRVSRRRKNPSDAVRAEVYRRDGHSCVRCGITAEELAALKKATTRKQGTHRHFLTLDHIVPYSGGGSNDPENLQTMCAACNELKGDLPYR